MPITIKPLGKALLADTADGRIASAHFVKKNGDEREINFRRGVSKYVTGEGLAFDPESKGLMVVYDLRKKAYRMINLNSVYAYRAHGESVTDE